jgi:cysteine synthase A
MGIRSTVKNGPAARNDPCHWQAEKLRQIEQVHLANPQPKVVSLESGTGNDIALVDERQSLGEGHKLWLALEILRLKLRGNALKPGMRVVQRCCCGSAAATMAYACARLELPFTAIVPNHLTTQARERIAAHGGEVAVADNPADAHDMEAGYALRPGYTVIDQYSAEVRALPTRHSPGERMLRSTTVAVGRMPSLVVTSVGTGTTANSVRFAASDRQMNIDIVGVDIAGGILTDYVGLNLHGRSDVAHLIEGASPGYVPPSFIRTSVDRFLEVRQEAAIAVCHFFKDEFNYEMGPSSGMAMFGALTELHKMKDRREGQLVATFCYDHGDRYAETIFNRSFLKEKGLEIDPWREVLEKLIADLK